MSPFTKGMRTAPGDRDKVVIYQDSAGKWRWRRVAPNGRILADSGQSYKSKAKCLKGLALATDSNYIITTEGETP